MDQFEQMIKMSSVNELHKKLKDIIYHACNLGKNIPTIENKDEQDMFLKEYLSSIDSISQIKEELRERELQKITKPPTTMERLLPTVAKIIQDHKPPMIDPTLIIDDSKPEEKEEQPKEIIKDDNVSFKDIEEIKEEIKEPIIEQPNIEQTTQPSIDNFQYSDETDVLRATDLVGFMNTPQPVVETADSRLETSSRKNTSRSDYNFTQDLSDFGIEDIDNN